MKFAEEQGIYAFGQASDMAGLRAQRPADRHRRQLGPLLLERVKAVLDGTWKSGDTWGGIKEGMVVLAPWSKKLPADVVKLAEAAQ